jgi:hypothetical protein
MHASAEREKGDGAARVAANRRHAALPSTGLHRKCVKWPNLAPKRPKHAVPTWIYVEKSRAESIPTHFGPGEVLEVRRQRTNILLGSGSCRSVCGGNSRLSVPLKANVGVESCIRGVRGLRSAKSVDVGPALARPHQPQWSRVQSAFCVERDVSSLLSRSPTYFLPSARCLCCYFRAAL